MEKKTCPHGIPVGLGCASCISDAMARLQQHRDLKELRDRAHRFSEAMRAVVSASTMANRQAQLDSVDLAIDQWNELLNSAPRVLKARKFTILNTGGEKP